MDGIHRRYRFVVGHSLVASRSAWIVSVKRNPDCHRLSPIHAIPHLGSRAELPTFVSFPNPLSLFFLSLVRFRCTLISLSPLLLWFGRSLVPLCWCMCVCVCVCSPPQDSPVSVQPRVMLPPWLISASVPGTTTTTTRPHYIVARCHSQDWCLTLSTDRDSLNSRGVHCVSPDPTRRSLPSFPPPSAPLRSLRPLTWPGTTHFAHHHHFLPLNV